MTHIKSFLSSRCLPFRGRLSQTNEQDPVLSKLNRRMVHTTLRLHEDGYLYVEDVIRASDYNVMHRYELYGDTEVDPIQTACAIRHEPNRYLDLYYYDKQSMNETRFVLNYREVDSTTYRIDHDACTSSLSLRFDAYKEIELENCPIEMATYLTEYLFRR